MNDFSKYKRNKSDHFNHFSLNLDAKQDGLDEATRIIMLMEVYELSEEEAIIVATDRDFAFCRYYKSEGYEPWHMQTLAESTGMGETTQIEMLQKVFELSEEEAKKIIIDGEPETDEVDEVDDSVLKAYKEALDNLVTRYSINFSPAESPISEAVTKFGGQPVWLQESQWPISQTLNKPMQFICQVKLNDGQFPRSEGKVAYVFMTEDNEGYPETWDPDGGDNAIIIQPNDGLDIKTEKINDGPSLKEYAATLVKTSDPAFIEREIRWSLPDNEYFDSISGNKIGGTPCFIQSDDTPEPIDEWSLLMQLEAETVPFDINFGDAGVAYAFIHKDGNQARFLWQCS